MPPLLLTAFVMRVMVNWVGWVRAAVTTESSHESTAGSVGVGYLWMSVCMCSVAEPALFGVCADCSRLSPPSKYHCLCVSCQASTPHCPWEQPGGQSAGAQPQQSHP